MLLGTLVASLLENILAGKEAIAASQGRGVNRAGEGTKSISEETTSTRQNQGIVRASYGNKKSSRSNNKKQNGFLIPPHPLTYFEIQKYYHNQRSFNGVYSRDNLPKIKDGAYVINLDEHSDIGTHWIALYVTLFDSFGVEHIPK